MLGHVLPASKKTLITRIRSYIRFLEFSDGFRADEILKLKRLLAEGIITEEEFQKEKQNLLK